METITLDREQMKALSNAIVGILDGLTINQAGDVLDYTKGAIHDFGVVRAADVSGPVSGCKS